jgi:hypothetical protein
VPKSFSLDQVKDMLKKSKKLADPATPCAEGEIKVWFWEIRKELEEFRGKEGPNEIWLAVPMRGGKPTVTITLGMVTYPNTDFHMVGCEKDCDKVPSKDGTKPIERGDDGKVRLKPGGEWNPYPMPEVIVKPFVRDGVTYRIRAFVLLQTTGVFCVKKTDLPK